MSHEMSCRIFRRGLRRAQPGEGRKTWKEKTETRQCVNYARQGMHSGARADKKKGLLQCRNELKFSRK